MKLPIIALTLSALCCAAVQAQSGEQETTYPQKWTAHDLLQACASSYLTTRGRGLRKYCSGFISGVEESVRLFVEPGAAGPTGAICVPSGKTSRHFVDMFVRYAAGRTADLKKPAARLVVDALAAEYPCP